MQEPHARLDEPAINAHHQEAHERQLPGAEAAREPSPPASGIGEGEEGHGQHHDGENAAELAVAHVERRPGPERGAQHGREEAPGGRSPSPSHRVDGRRATPLTFWATTPTRFVAFAVGPGQAHEDQKGQGQEGSASGQDVQDRGDEAGDGEEEEGEHPAPGVCHARCARESRQASEEPLNWPELR